MKSNKDIAMLQNDSDRMIAWSDKCILQCCKEKYKLLSINGWLNAKYCINSNSKRYEIGRVKSKNDICANFDIELEFVINMNETKQARSICAMLHRFIGFSMRKHPYDDT